MYCRLLFIDYLNYKRYMNESISTLKSVRSIDSDPVNIRLFFNPNCILRLILDYICTEAHINLDGDNYDLCTLSGDLIGVKNYSSITSGLTIFQRRETYFIVFIKRSVYEDQIEDFTPLINPTCDIYDTLLKNLREKNLPKSKKLTLKRSSSSRHSTSKQSVTYSHQSFSQTSTSSKTKRSSSSKV